MFRKAALVVGGCAALGGASVVIAPDATIGVAEKAYWAIRRRQQQYNIQKNGPPDPKQAEWNENITTICGGRSSVFRDMCTFGFVKFLGEHFLRDRKYAKPGAPPLPSVGEFAPDVPVVDVATLRTKNMIADHAQPGRPLVLLFGSATWPPHRETLNTPVGTAPSIQQIYNRYKGKVDFLHIYIKEIHPVGSWELKGSLNNKPLSQPASLQERVEHANFLKTSKQVPMPMVVDSMTNEADWKYHVNNTRFVILEPGESPQRKIKFICGAGPYGYRLDLLDSQLSEMCNST